MRDNFKAKFAYVLLKCEYTSECYWGVYLLIWNLFMPFFIPPPIPNLSPLGGNIYIHYLKQTYWTKFLVCFEYLSLPTLSSSFSSSSSMSSPSSRTASSMCDQLGSDLSSSSESLPVPLLLSMCWFVRSLEKEESIEAIISQHSG